MKKIIFGAAYIFILLAENAFAKWAITNDYSAEHAADFKPKVEASLNIWKEKNGYSQVNLTWDDDACYKTTMYKETNKKVEIYVNDFQFYGDISCYRNKAFFRFDSSKREDINSISGAVQDNSENGTILKQISFSFPIVITINGEGPLVFMNQNGGWIIPKMRN